METLKISNKLSNKAMQKIFFNSLCNAVSAGVTLGYGIKIYSKKEDYVNAKQNLLSKSGSGTVVCVEDVWMQILKEKNYIYSKDIENNDGEYSKKINLSDVYEGIKKVDNDTILNFLEENDDANDADVVIQTVFFGEVIFG